MMQPYNILNSLGSGLLLLLFTHQGQSGVFLDLLGLLGLQDFHVIEVFLGALEQPDVKGGFGGAGLTHHGAPLLDCPYQVNGRVCFDVEAQKETVAVLVDLVAE